MELSSAAIEEDSLCTFAEEQQIIMFRDHTLGARSNNLLSVELCRYHIHVHSLERTEVYKSNVQCV